MNVAPPANNPVARARRSDLLLLITAAVWGFAFVAQRVGMFYLGPLTFNGWRFLLGALVLTPWLGRKQDSHNRNDKRYILQIAIAGFILFAAASLQQVGMVHTTAGKGGFITGLYLILVPILGIPLGQRTHGYTWVGAVLALWGLYFLSITGNLHFAPGDLPVFLSAFFWAGHVLWINRLASYHQPFRLAAGQFIVCGLLSLLAAAWQEESPLIPAALLPALPALLYAGVVSVGLAYTLQVVAQKDAPPAHAALIMGLEGVFAFLGGILLLHESLSRRNLLGALLMTTGVLLSQHHTRNGPGKGNQSNTRTPEATK